MSRTKLSEVKRVVGNDALEGCAKELLEVVFQEVTGGDSFECAAEDLAIARGHNLSGAWDVATEAAYKVALNDIVVVVLVKVWRQLLKQQEVEDD